MIFMSLLDKKELNEVVHDISIKFFGKPFHDKAIYNHRLRTTGGRYVPARRTIEMNPKYTSEFDEEEIIGIIKHELCHYHLHIEGKGYKHSDKDFKNLLRMTGYPSHCALMRSHTFRYNNTYRHKNYGHINRH